MPKSASIPIHGSSQPKADPSWLRARSHISEVLAAEQAKEDTVLARVDAMRLAKERILSSMEGRGPAGELMKACFLDDARGAKAALAAGCPVDSVDGHGDGALRVCVHWGRLGIMRILIEHGAAVDLPGRWGETALDLAIDFNRHDCAEILLESGARTDARSTLVSKLPSSHQRRDGGGFHNAAPQGTPDPWGAIVPVDLPQSILDQTLRGEQPLARAAHGRWPDPKMVQLLLSKGADPTDSDGFGCTALMRAAFAGDLESCRALIEAGADPRAVDIDGRDAMAHALVDRDDFDDLDERDPDDIQETFRQAIAKREARVLRDHAGAGSSDESPAGSKRI